MAGLLGFSGGYREEALPVGHRERSGDAAAGGGHPDLARVAGAGGPVAQPDVVGAARGGGGRGGHVLAARARPGGGAGADADRLADLGRGALDAEVTGLPGGARDRDLV